MTCSVADVAMQPTAAHRNVSEGSFAVWDSIASHFGVDFTPSEVQVMKEKARFDAKVPQLTFAGDSEEKRARASVEARRAAEMYLDVLYVRLEDHRLSKSA